MQVTNYFRTPQIILNPNAGDLLPIRAWPLDRYIELGRRLLAEDPRAVLLVMGTDEAAADAARIVAELGPERVVDFAGKTAFEDLLPLFELGGLLVTNDSGPAHFAALTPISILAFFGPESPRLYRPLSDRHRALYAEYHCSPCLNAYTTAPRVVRTTAACSASRSTRPTPPPGISWRTGGVGVLVNSHWPVVSRCERHGSAVSGGGFRARRVRGLRVRAG
jgi:hypothetical protein